MVHKIKQYTIRLNSTHYAHNRVEEKAISVIPE